MTATDADADADACCSSFIPVTPRSAPLFHPIFFHSFLPLSVHRSLFLYYIGSRKVTLDDGRSVTNTVVDGLCLTYRMFVPVTLTHSFNHPV
mmetsp:Transcript_34674/g.38842  ORF Transcript_34674/g.38842 Transcript_34674/m.38842 type:complete len:92 (+) Transcript_34674:3-278(+)